MKSHFYNQYGFRDTVRRVDYLFDHCFPTTIYHVTLDPLNPMQWVDKFGFAWTMNKSFDSDRGSVPSCLHWLCEPDTFLKSFYMHDSACRFKGLHRSTIINQDGEFVPLTRLQCDEMLHQWVLDEGGARWQANGIYYGVRAGARLGIGGNWGAGDLRKASK
jgi:hypothetical protein